MPSGTLFAKKYAEQREMPSAKKMDRAFRAAYYDEPKYTIRANVSFGAQIMSEKQRRNAGESAVTAGPIDYRVSKSAEPRYSMRKRTCKMLQLPGQSTDSVPGPGTYPVPSTSYFDHPCLPMPGRTTMKGPPRFKDDAMVRDRVTLKLKPAPGPAEYNVATLKKEFYNLANHGDKPPSFSIRKKIPLRTKGFCDVTSGPIEYRTTKTAEPRYSMRMRTCKMLQVPGQSTDSVPGPGAYPVPTTTNFDHPTEKMPGRATVPKAPRFDYRDPNDVFTIHKKK